MIFLAQAAADPQWVVLIAQTGVAGAVLCWFMLRTEGRLKAIENANDRLARANLLLVVSLHQANETAKEQARVIIKEIDETKVREGK